MAWFTLLPGLLGVPPGSVPARARDRYRPPCLDAEHYPQALDHGEAARPGGRRPHRLRRPDPAHDLVAHPLRATERADGRQHLRFRGRRRVSPRCSRWGWRWPWAHLAPRRPGGHRGLRRLRRRPHLRRHLAARPAGAAAPRQLEQRDRLPASLTQADVISQTEVAPGVVRTVPVSLASATPRSLARAWRAWVEPSTSFPAPASASSAAEDCDDRSRSTPSSSPRVTSGRSRAWRRRCSPARRWRCCCSQPGGHIATSPEIRWTLNPSIPAGHASLGARLSGARSGTGPGETGAAERSASARPARARAASAIRRRRGLRWGPVARGCQPCYDDRCDHHAGVPGGGGSLAAGLVAPGGDPVRRLHARPRPPQLPPADRGPRWGADRDRRGEGVNPSSSPVRARPGQLSQFAPEAGNGGGPGASGGSSSRRVAAHRLGRLSRPACASTGSPTSPIPTARATFTWTPPGSASTRRPT